MSNLVKTPTIPTEKMIKAGINEIRNLADDYRNDFDMSDDAYNDDELLSDVVTFIYQAMVGAK